MAGLSSLAFSAGAATANPALMGVGAVGTLVGGLVGAGRANRVADIQEEITVIQNQIFAEQNQVERENLLLRRRQMFRQEAQRLAGARVAATASGSARSSTFGGVTSAIRSQTQENVGRINRALESGERLSGLSQQLSELQSEAAEVSQPGFFETIFS